MNQTLSIAAVAGLLLFAAGCQKMELKEFSPDGTFKVLMPEKKDEKRENIGGVSEKSWTSEFNDGGLQVSVRDAYGGDLMAEERVKDAQKLQVANLRCEVTNESAVKLQDKYPGRSFEGKLKVRKKSG